MFVKHREESGYISRKEANEVLKLCGFVEVDKKKGFWMGGRTATNSAARVSQNIANKQWKIQFGTSV